MDLTMEKTYFLVINIIKFFRKKECKMEPMPFHWYRALKSNHSYFTAI